MNKLVSIPIAEATPISPDGVDPVYAIIDRHKALSIAYNKAVHHPDADRDNSDADRAVATTSRELIAHATQLFAFTPSTVEGVVALMRYISSLKDWQMPACFGEPKEIGGLKKLTKSMADALSNTKRSEEQIVFSAPALPALDVSRSGPHPDAKLFATISHYREAFHEWRALRTAFDEIEFHEPRPPGYKAKQRAADKAASCAGKIEAKIIAAVPTTLDGLIAKVRSGDGGWFRDDEMRTSIANDVQRLRPSHAIRAVTACTPLQEIPLVDAGKKLEPLVLQYFEANRDWATNQRRKNDKGRAAANERMSALSDEMQPLLRIIAEFDAVSVLGLRAKTLAALRDALIPKDCCDRSLAVEHEQLDLLRAAADLSGLRSLMIMIESRLAVVDE